MNAKKIDIRLHSNIAYYGIFLIASVALFIKFHVDKHLALDGVGYFYQILENRDFANIAWSRRFTEYLTEWPLVLAVNIGIKDIPMLIDIFSWGIYFPYILSFLLCCYATRDEDISLLWFPLAGYIGFNVLSDYDLIADHHVMAVMTWPILLILLKTRPLSWREGAVLWMLLFLYSRMYETAVLTAGLLFLLAVIRVIRYWNSREKIISGVAMILLIVVMVIAINYIISPRDPGNRGSFLDAIWVNKRNWEAIATMAFLGIFGLGWIITEKWNQLRSVVFFASLLPIGYYVFLRFTTEYAMTAYISFSSRTLIGVILPGLIVLAAIVVNTKRKLNGLSIGVFLVTFIVMTGYNLADLRYWLDVKREFISVVDSDAGYISIDDTSLKDSHYRWSWNNTLLSLVWSDLCVRAIITNSPSDPQGPVDPKKRLILKDYLVYDAYFLDIDPSINVCDS